MRRAIKDKRRYAFISCFSLVGAMVLTAFAVVFFTKAVYVAMAIFAFISAICYYASAFSLFLRLDAKAAIELIEVMDSYEYGERMNVSEIADGMCWSKRATKKFIAKCKKRGYLRY